MASPLWAAPGDINSVPAPTIGADAPKAHDIKVGDASVSTQTGAVTYSYPITVPPGRLGMQPSLALSYSSQAPVYGGVASGWSLEIPEIRRDTSVSMLEQDYFDGLDVATSWQRERFESTLAGGRPLVAVSEPSGLPTDARGTFRAQNDTAFDRYERMQPGQPFSWRVRSHSGVTHYVGHATLAPASSDKWAPLTRSEDPFGNAVEYQWSGTNITQIRYTENKPAGLPAFAKVDFVWVASPACTSTMAVGELKEARLGLSRGTQRLSQLRATVHDTAPLPETVRHTRQFTLGYDATAADCTAKHGPINLLTSIQESAWGDTEPRVDLPAAPRGDLPVQPAGAHVRRDGDPDRHQPGLRLHRGAPGDEQPRLGPPLPR